MGKLKFSPVFSTESAAQKVYRKRKGIRPIRPTMRPHDDEMIIMRFFLTFSNFVLLKLIFMEA